MQVYERGMSSMKKGVKFTNKKFKKLDSIREKVQLFVIYIYIYQKVHEMKRLALAAIWTSEHVVLFSRMDCFVIIWMLRVCR